MKKKIILKSTHPSDYPDLEVECRVIPNDQIGAYLDTIPDEKKVVGYKNGVVRARRGVEGEKVKTILKTIVEGREYILSEEEGTVKDRDGELDVVITNISSTSNEEYIVKYSRFMDTYDITTSSDSSEEVIVPKVDSRVITQVDENVIIMTAWGEPAICLKGSYIVTYNADENDYNTLEQGAFESTYTVSKSKRKIK